MRNLIFYVVVLLSLPAAAQPKFRWCDPQSPSLGWGIAPDVATYAQYQFDFKMVKDPSKTVSVVVFTNKPAPPLSSYELFRFDETYSVQTRFRQSDAEAWSPAGPPCTFTPRNAFYFKWCDPPATPSLAWGLVANDQNVSSAEYEFEFSEHSDFSDSTKFPLTNRQSPPMLVNPFFRYDVLYYVKVRAKQRPGDPLSLAGKPCTFTAKNDTRFKWCSIVPSSYGLVAEDQNQSYESYLFEFAEDRDFKKIAATITLAKNQSPPLQTRPELKPGKIYFVQVRVLTRGAVKYSLPGPACTFGMCAP